ncbi:o-succinylbenzoate synthase [Shimazuella sp. AN120528]|uniref:o-succinylbenzoate synthase n=1 Tax=Shimazuella soli TaxID=1892854 RepID=UPI001F116768|nr:o-succinylbenzoate synthase [Shimazuella soli]MCH5584969.1 o-succinylbenzoate synthase [Shimazuella soli]
MRIDKIILRQLKMKMVSPFRTSFGTQTDREFLLTEVHGEGWTGFGECVVNTAPMYNEETVGTAKHIIEQFLIPILFERGEFIHPDNIRDWFSPIRRNMMAKSSLEGAVWDLYAKSKGQTLAQALGGEKDKIEVGISIGIQEQIDDLYRLVEQYLEQGYRRMKIKIKPGKDIEVLQGLRARFGNIPMMADANSAYTLDDLSLFKEIDDLGLMMIEQPLAHDDIVDHAKLQRELKTPVCLDESIHSLEDARKAIELGSTRVINIKIGRVGGLTEAKRIHDYALEHGVPVWCGGMLESGIGRAHNIAITSLPNFTLPGDTAGSTRYWQEDIIDPFVEVQNDGTIILPTNSGIGYHPNAEKIEKYTIWKKEYTTG